MEFKKLLNDDLVPVVVLAVRGIPGVEGCECDNGGVVSFFGIAGLVSLLLNAGEGADLGVLLSVGESNTTGVTSGAMTGTRGFLPFFVRGLCVTRGLSDEGSELTEFVILSELSVLSGDEDVTCSFGA